MAGESDRAYRAVVIGGSAGGMEALLEVLSRVPASFPLPLIVAQHLHKSDGGRFAEHLGSRVPLAVSEARDKQAIAGGHLYVAPADYHLLVERNGTLALSVDARVNWARPAIDVLFESAARAFAEAVVAVILSGANDDGARGMKLVRALGGFCIAQDPDSAESPLMPRAAIALAAIEHVLRPAEIGEMLGQIGETVAKQKPGGLGMMPS
jgi:two-component system chemotaxis response regulator CheB